MTCTAATPIGHFLHFMVASASVLVAACTAPNHAALVDHDEERALMCPSGVGLVTTGGARLSLGSVETSWQALPVVEAQVACACTGRTLEDHRTGVELTATYFRCSDMDSPCPNPSRGVGSLSHTISATPIANAEYVADSPGCEGAPASVLPHCSLSALRAGHVESIRADAETLNLLVRDCMRHRAFESWTAQSTPPGGSDTDAWPDATACVREAMKTAAEFRAPDVDLDGACETVASPPRSSADFWRAYPLVNKDWTTIEQFLLDLAVRASASGVTPLSLIPVAPGTTGIASADAPTSPAAIARFSWFRSLATDAGITKTLEVQSLNWLRRYVAATEREAVAPPPALLSVYDGCQLRAEMESCDLRGLTVGDIEELIERQAAGLGAVTISDPVAYLAEAFVALDRLRHAGTPERPLYPWLTTSRALYAFTDPRTTSFTILDLPTSATCATADALRRSYPLDVRHFRRLPRELNQLDESARLEASNQYPRNSALAAAAPHDVGACGRPVCWWTYTSLKLEPDNGEDVVPEEIGPPGRGERLHRFQTRVPGPTADFGGYLLTLNGYCPQLD